MPRPTPVAKDAISINAYSLVLYKFLVTVGLRVAFVQSYICVIISTAFFQV